MSNDKNSLVPPGVGQDTSSSGQLTVPQVLRAAADLLEPDGAWIQHHYARTVNHLICSPNAEEATCFCLNGAVSRASGQSTWVVEESAGPLAAVRAALGVTTTHSWNDAKGRTQAEVVAMLRLAADQAESAAERPGAGDSGTNQTGADQ